jgi:CNT family concentrative nucleoside transporter
LQQLVGLLGVIVLPAIAWALSTHRRRVHWRIVIGGVVLQFVLAFLLLRFPPVVRAFDVLARIVSRIIGFTDAGIEFVVGEQLADPNGPAGFVFAFRALPVIIFFGSLMAVLYHLRLMQLVVAGLAWLLRRTLGVTGAEALAMAANVFVGQTEAPLCVKPYLEKMTRSQLMALMTGGFATIAGSVLAVYVLFVGGTDEAEQQLFIKHLLTASVLSAPAAFVMAKLLVPETEQAEDEIKLLSHDTRTTCNVIDAAAAGATDGLRLAVNVGAVLIAFVALLAMINYPLEALSEWTPVADWRNARDIPPITLEYLLGMLFAPLAWTMGIPWHDCLPFGSLMGQKIIATEFVAYQSLGEMARASGDAGPALSRRSIQIGAYALCGFANLASIGIQIGGISALAPGRRHDLSRLGLRAMIGGALASWMTASIAGVMIAP